MLTFFIVPSTCRVQLDQWLTRTDGYLLADRVSLARIRFQPLGEFFKAKWSQDKVLILPKEPKDLLQTVIQPCPRD